MKMKPHEPGRSTGLLRVASGVAATALIASALGTVSAQADDENDDPYLGTPEDFGFTKGESDSVIQGNTFTGDPAFHGRYFVELSQPATIEGTTSAAVSNEQDSFLDAADDAGVSLEVEQTYGTLWNGLSVSAAEADLQELANLPQVQSIFPVYVIDQPEPAAADAAPMMENAIGMSRADLVNDELGITGEGIRIGIVDSGVDIDHPIFGGDGEPGDGLDPDWRHDGLRVEYGYDFVGDSYNASLISAGYDPELRPDENPDDCGGHGTHVAGIAAGGVDEEAGVRGVAPDATIGAYRVFSCSGSTSSDVILAALEYAYNDDMDVVNMSLGAAFWSWNEYPTSLASDALVDAGVVVVNSAGNEGSFGPFATGSPGASHRAIGVASVDNTVVELNVIAISGEPELELGYAPGSGAGPIPTEGSIQVSRIADPGTPEARACAGIADDVDIAGTAVLIERGDCTFHEKALAGQEAGADAIVIYNNVPGVFFPSAAGVPEVTIPVIALDGESGAALDERVQEDPETTLTWTEETAILDSPTAGLMSSFSSYGPEANLDFKPDIAGPGGNIMSSVPLEQGGFAVNSGTSMSAPHVSGTAALLLAAESDLNPDQVRERLQNYAEPAAWSGNPEAGLLEPVNRQGAGSVDIYAAITNGVEVSPSKIAVNYRDADATTSTQTLELTNATDEDVTYEILNDTTAVGLEVLSFDWVFWLYEAGLDAPESVTVPAGGTASVEVTITEPALEPGEDGSVAENQAYGGYITLVPDSDTEVLRVPYTGFAGDYLALDVLTPGPGDVALPILAQLQPDTCERVIGLDCVWQGTWSGYDDTGDGSGLVFTLEDETQVPTVLIQRAHQATTQQVAVWAVDEEGNPTEEIGLASDLDFLGRHEAPTEFDAVTWDGTIDGEAVEDGRYAFETRVLKALGDEDNAAHWESAVSEPFTLEADPAAYAGPHTVDRLPGEDRFVTSGLIAQRFDADEVDTIYLATGTNYPDALAGAARAAAEGNPVVLVPDNLEERGMPLLTGQAINDLDPENLVILGGEAVVSAEGEEVIREFAGDRDVSRVAGANRYATAAEIALGTDTDSDTVYVAIGSNFPDALTAAAVAGNEDAPLVLSRTNSLHPATEDALAELSPSTIVVVGGSAAISDAVVEDLEEYADTVERVAGSNRFGTAEALAMRMLEQGGTVGESAYIATGANFPDALAGAALAGAEGVPLLLVGRTSVPDSTLAAIQAFEPGTLVLLGGTGVISVEVEDILRGDGG